MVVVDFGIEIFSLALTLWTVPRSRLVLSPSSEQESKYFDHIYRFHVWKACTFPSALI
jgi:hypothetical protein